jgi:hypothetical protein
MAGSGRTVGNHVRQSLKAGQGGSRGRTAHRHAMAGEGSGGVIFADREQMARVSHRR